MLAERHISTRLSGPQGWTMDGGLQTGKDLKDCWSQCLVWGWGRLFGLVSHSQHLMLTQTTWLDRIDCRAVGFNPTTGKCQFSLGSRGSVASLEVLAAKNMSRTLVNVPCEKLTLSGDQACKSPGHLQSRQNRVRLTTSCSRTPQHLVAGRIPD
jgi:hypothetical protein